MFGERWKGRLYRAKSAWKLAGDATSFRNASAGRHGRRTRAEVGRAEAGRIEGRRTQARAAKIASFPCRRGPPRRHGESQGPSPPAPQLRRANPWFRRRALQPISSSADPFVFLQEFRSPAARRSRLQAPAARRSRLQAPAPHRSRARLNSPPQAPASGRPAQSPS
jgi:hypothetical protein